jgi:hypothetical protein
MVLEATMDSNMRMEVTEEMELEVVEEADIMEVAEEQDGSAHSIRIMEVEVAEGLHILLDIQQ